MILLLTAILAVTFTAYTAIKGWRAAVLSVALNWMVAAFLGLFVAATATAPLMIDPTQRGWIMSLGIFCFAAAAVVSMLAVAAVRLRETD